MTNVQRRVTELLKEIDSVCMEEGIGYSLAGRTAAMCTLSGAFTCDDYQADIIMKPDDYRRFCKAVSGKENRAIESLENNPLLDGVYARYVDTSTTLMDMKRGFGLKEQGVCVRIWPLRSKALKSRYRKALETLVRTNNMVSLKVKKEYCSDKEKIKVSGLSAAQPQGKEGVLLGQGEDQGQRSFSRKDPSQKTGHYEEVLRGLPGRRCQ